MTIDILNYDDLPVSSCTGLKEQRLIMSTTLFKQYVNPGTWEGLGDVVYIANAQLSAETETVMHDHKEIDLISVIIDGRIVHKGSLGDGQEIEKANVQVQRAGKEGFSHNEVNPGKSSSRMIQLWVLPEEKAESSAYKFYKLTNKVTRIYGGDTGQTNTFASHTIIEVALIKISDNFSLERPFLAYLVVGEGSAGKQKIKEGSLLKGEKLNFKAKSDATLIIIYTV